MEAHSLAQASGGLTVPRSRKLLGAFGDERLVEQLRRGNDVAFEVLYDRHHRGVLSYCRHMLGSREEAEDALQQAFVSAHTDIVASDKPIRFKAWIYTIARNRCLSILRARREQPSDDIEVVSTAGLSEEVQQRADLQQLLSDLHELPEDQRAALILSELGDLSHSDVAEVIGCEVAKVKSLVFQARSGLIERREARETPCEEIREQLATLRGGSLRRGPLRRHLKACPGCAEFREEVRRQRQMVAAILPVIPTLGLRESAFAAVGIGGAATGGGVMAGGGAIVAAKASVAKIAVIALATGSVVGGGVAVQQAVDHSDNNGGAAKQPAGEAIGAEEALGVNAISTDRGHVVDRTKHGEKTVADRDKRSDQPGTRADGRGHRRDTRSDVTRRDDAGLNGFVPERGTSNGERARDFARTRGKGRKRGLDKEHANAGKAKARDRSQQRRGGAPPDRPAQSREGKLEKPEKSEQPPGPLGGPPAPISPGLGNPPRSMSPPPLGLAVKSERTESRQRPSVR